MKTSNIGRNVTGYTNYSYSTHAQQLAAFVATRKVGIHVDYTPSEAPATEEYSYKWNGAIWVIRCEDGRYVYSWTHPCNQDAPTLAEAERALFKDAQFAGR